MTNIEGVPYEEGGQGASAGPEGWVTDLEEVLVLGRRDSHLTEFLLR